MATDQFPRYSDMEFVSNNTFVVEDSPTLKNAGEKVRTVEFIRRKENKLLFIEAKSTFANPNNSPIPYGEEISKVCEKFVHSLNLLSSIKVGVANETLPQEFDYESLVTVSFVLVIRNHEKAWCRPIKNGLEQSLPLHIKKIWKPAVLVINYETARTYDLVK